MLKFDIELKTTCIKKLFETDILVSPYSYFQKE